MKKMQRLGVVDDRVVRLGSPVATNEMLKQYPEEVLNARLAVLDEAYNHFFMKGPGHNLKCQREFTVLYDDLISHEDAWFAIFSMDENHIHAERCIGILGTLATSHRQAGERDRAEEIMAFRRSNNCSVRRYDLPKQRKSAG